MILINNSNQRNIDNVEMLVLQRWVVLVLAEDANGSAATTT